MCEASWFLQARLHHERVLAAHDVHGKGLGLQSLGIAGSTLRVGRSRPLHVLCGSGAGSVLPGAVGFGIGWWPEHLGPETVQPVTPTESGIAIGKGGHLCEIVLWAQWRHVGSARAIHESNIVQVIAKGFAECIRRDPAVDSVAAMYARMFVQLANDRERIPEDWQEICNDEMTALTDSLSEYSPDSETPKNLMSRIMALTKPKARSF